MPRMTFGGQRLRRPRSMLVVWAALGLIVVAAVVVLVLMSNRSDKDAQAPHLTPTPTTAISPSSAPRVGSLAKFSGHGDKTTTAFLAVANWEIKWGTQTGKPFAVELIGKNGTSRGQIVVAKKQPQGSTFVSEAGEFSLKVSAAGDWSIQVNGSPPPK